LPYLLLLKEQGNISAIDQYVIDFVRELRVAKNLGQEEIGSILGLRKSFIGNVESLNNRAKYNLRHINLLADYFELSPGYFLPQEPIISKTKKQKDEIINEIQNKIGMITKRNIKKLK